MQHHQLQLLFNQSYWLSQEELKSYRCRSFLNILKLAIAYITALSAMGNHVILITHRQWGAV